jgi:hypothetical protein
VEDYRVGIAEPMDFGDAPTNNYPTLLSQNAARHRLVANSRLGAVIDSEPDGQPNTSATGDDINPSNADDEDGVTFTSSTTVTHFRGLFSPAQWPRLAPCIRGLCLGPITRASAQAAGVRIAVEADEASIPALLKALVQADGRG